MFWIACVMFVRMLSCAISHNKVLMVRYPKLDEKNLTTSRIMSLANTEAEAKSLAICARKCAKLADCAAFYYDSLTRQCHLQNDLYVTADGGVTQKGLRYFYKPKGRSEWCPEERGFQLLGMNGPCVKYHTDIKTWYEASQTCVSYSPYSRLVVLDNQEKNELVKATGNAINDQFNVGLAIGISDHAENTYRWVDGKPLDFADWSSADASLSGVENCVHLFRADGWTWLRIPCFTKGHYICEIAVDVDLYHKMMNIF